MLVADDCRHGDCARYQVCCPVCREAVFKGERCHEARETKTHYFSHYRAKEADAAQCELRIASLAGAYLGQITVEGRGQTLSRFMAVFRQRIASAQEKLGIMPIKEMIGAADALMSRPIFIKYANSYARLYDLVFSSPDAQVDLANAIQDMPAYQDRSLFWTRRQSSYALDVLRHLSINQMEKNRRFLIACAMVICAKGFNPYISAEALDKNEPDPIMNAIIHALVNGVSSSMIEKIENRTVRPRPAAQNFYAKEYKDNFHLEITEIVKNNPIDLAKEILKKRECELLREVEEKKAQMEIKKQEFLLLSAARFLLPTIAGMICAVEFPSPIVECAKEKASGASI